MRGRAIQRIFVMKPDDLTAEQIVLALGTGASVGNVNRYWPDILNALREHDLDMPYGVAFALGTVAAESAGFVPLNEFRSRYNTNRAPFDKYEGRVDLGNTNPGDGARYKGRGFVQLTGRDNYRRYGQMIGVDLEGNPELANTPDVAAKLLASFILSKWQRIQMALKHDNLKTARRLVNGGIHGFERFEPAYRNVLALLS